MKEKSRNTNGISLRKSLKLSVLALAGLTLIGLVTAGNPGAVNPHKVDPGNFYPTLNKTDRYSYYEKLPQFTPGMALDSNEMRITFLGSMIPPVRRAQQEMSVFVEVGWVVDDKGNGKPLDQFVFDCGSGVVANYGAMGIGYDRMDKVFLCHLHGDHMSDLSHIYCFGPSAGRYSPLYVWGPSASQIEYTDLEGKSYPKYDDGTKTYCEMLRKAMRWHSESFSFQNTSYASYTAPTKQSWGLPVDPIPVGDPEDPDTTNPEDADPRNDGYALVPIELDWTKNGSGTDANGNPDNIAYWNKTTGVKITHFPVIHTRKGAIGYKLEWKNPNDPNAPVRTMIYTSDTRPEQNSIDQAINGGKGVDVFIHEMVVPPEVWAFKNMGLSAPPKPQSKYYDAFVNATAQAQMVQDSSHTPQGAFGYLLSQIIPRPGLTVPTHFPTADDTVACALESVQVHCPDIKKLGDKIAWSFDLMVIRVYKKNIQQLRANVSDFGWSPRFQVPPDANSPKYWQYQVDANGNIQYDSKGNPIKIGDPLAQIKWQDVIPPTNPDGTENYREDGY